MLYILCNTDPAVHMSNDRKIIVGTTWDDVKRSFNAGGNLIYNLRQAKEYIDKNIVHTSHL